VLRQLGALGARFGEQRRDVDQQRDAPGRLAAHRRRGARAAVRCAVGRPSFARCIVPRATGAAWVAVLPRFVGRLAQLGTMFAARRVRPPSVVAALGVGRSVPVRVVAVRRWAVPLPARPIPRVSLGCVAIVRPPLGTGPIVVGAFASRRRFGGGGTDRRRGRRFGGSRLRRAPRRYRWFVRTEDVRAEV